MHHNPTYLGSPILIQIIPNERTHISLAAVLATVTFPKTAAKEAIYSTFAQGLFLLGKYLI